MDTKSMSMMPIPEYDLQGVALGIDLMIVSMDTKLI
jgi:hypothetical protein